jgi:MFS family permease
MFAFGGVFGLMIGGNITHNFVWHMTLLSILPFTIGLTFRIRCFVKLHDKPPVVKEANNRELFNDITNPDSNQRYVKSYKIDSGFDIKGTVTLASTIISLILALTLVQSENNVSVKSSISISTLLFIFSGLSLFIFIFLERKTSAPLINLQLIKLKPIFMTNIIILIWGIATFTIFQTIPVLMRTPQPMGFGGSALDVVYLTLPFSIMSLIFGPTSGFIISKVGSFRVILAGSIIATIGFGSILVLYNNLIWTAISLGIIGSGLSLLNVGQIYINTASTPIKFIGISFGVNTLFRYVGSAIGPAIAGMFMQTNQTSLKISDEVNNIAYYPSSNSFMEIFLCMTSLVFISVILSIMIKRHRIQAKP